MIAPLLQESSYEKLSLRANGKTSPRRTRFDWKHCSINPDLQQQFTVEVKNQFDSLDQDETPTENYQRLIDATEETTEQLVPKVKKTRRSWLSTDPRVEAAINRTKVNDACSKYQQTRNETNRYDYEQARKELEEAYNIIAEEELSYKVRQAHVNGQHGQALKLINEISGRRTSQRGQIAGDTQQERIQNWYNRFVGSEPDASVADINIPTIFKDLGIKDGPFDEEEYLKAKKTLTEGKACQW